ncbi:MAG: UDP-N-acetylmuramate dehydrogenase [Chitinophagaceae bacterium]
MQILENISLKYFNTFHIDAKAKYFSTFNSVEELEELLSYQKSAISDQQSQTKIYQPSTFILGGGSNILFTKNFDGLILKNDLKGIELIKEDEEYFYVKANAGENWHQFVLHCIENNYAGIENLSLIPGNVGATPMQNIGAYGVEIKDVFAELEAYSINDKTLVIFNLDDCEFGYRESVFKKKYKNNFVILNVTYKLRKKPVYNISYGAIAQELEKTDVKELSIKAISQAVINIRRSKLPDPAEIGNAGSFFKNPQIRKNVFDELKQKFPNIVGYAITDNEIKVAAGWLIEQCSWKGYREGDAGCNAKQALVLVNYGNASGAQILNLSKKIVESVQQKFKINLETEVNIV